MKYLDRIVETCIKANRKSLKHGDGKAWDNKKGKNMKQYHPRGKAYLRVVALENKAWWDNQVKFLEEIKSWNINNPLTNH